MNVALKEKKNNGGLFLKGQNCMYSCRKSHNQQFAKVPKIFSLLYKAIIIQLAL